MDELDQLKKQWKENENFAKLNQDDIKTMLHKSSTSIVKWIFIICCLEFLIGLVLAFLLPFDQEELLVLEIFNWGYTIIAYIAIIYFIYIFYTLFNKINSINSTKYLIENILAVRKNADYYIKFNLCCMIFSFIFAVIRNMINEFYESHSWSMVLFAFILGSIISFAIGYIFIKIAKGYYHIIYGRLLRKLNINYEELTRLEEES